MSECATKSALWVRWFWVWYTRLRFHTRLLSLSLSQVCLLLVMYLGSFLDGLRNLIKTYIAIWHIIPVLWIMYIHIFINNVKITSVAGLHIVSSRRFKLINLRHIVHGDIIFVKLKFIAQVKSLSECICMYVLI